MSSLCGALMTVVVEPVDLFDSGDRGMLDAPQVATEAACAAENECTKTQASHMALSNSYVESSEAPLPVGGDAEAINVVILPREQCSDPELLYWNIVGLSLATSTPNPLPPELKKYWRQRHRLFSKFDQGIRLDETGWFSVTPEQIANFVAKRLKQSLPQARSGDHVLLDAFCGCGGNAIAFARAGFHVFAVDIDRGTLRNAAQNAAVYGVPHDKIAFIECNSVFILEFCYKNGAFMLDKPMAAAKAEAFMNAMPPSVATEVHAGYTIGGIDMLPPNIDAIFMDPPFGGIDYGLFGKTGYDLQAQMKIARAPQLVEKDDFFDAFVSKPRSKQERKMQFNCGIDDDNSIDGSELLALAAAASSEERCVVFDVPRNINRRSLGMAALAAGYRGSCRLQEHHLNGRLKTATVYFGGAVNGTDGNQ